MARTEHTEAGPGQLLRDGAERGDFVAWDDFRADAPQPWVVYNTDFSGLDLATAELSHVEFHGCDFRGAIVDPGTIDRTSFKRCDMRGCSFVAESSKHLGTADFGGTDLDGASMPNADGLFDALVERLSDIVEHTRTLMYTILIFSAFMLITILSTDVTELAIGASRLKIPGFDQTVPLFNVLIGGACFGLAATIYFHVFISRWWSIINILPARFPDGRPLAAVIPSSMVGFVTLHWLERAGHQTATSVLLKRTPGWRWMRNLVANAALFWSVPAILALAFVALLFGAEPWKGLLVGALTLVGIFSSANAYELGQLSVLAKRRTLISLIRVALPTLPVLIVMLLIASPWHDEIYDRLAPDFTNARLENLEFGRVRIWNPVFSGASLRGSDLREVVFNDVGTSDQRVRFDNTDLRDVRLSRQVLTNADFFGANMSNADLSGAVLVGAVFRGAAMDRVRLPGADLSHASLRDAFLDAADLTAITGEGASFARAGLKTTQLRNANLQRAIFRDAVLQDANLQGATLGDSDLRGVDLRNAGMHGVNLKFADLSGADLRGAQGLTWQQLVEARSLHGVQLDDALVQDVLLRRPDLLEQEVKPELLHPGASPDTMKAVSLIREYIRAASLPQGKPGEKLLLATWNIRSLGQWPRTEKGIHIIAELISAFDLVAVTELKRNLGDLARVLDVLGPSWGLLVSGYGGDPAANSERMAIIFDRTRVTFTGYVTHALEDRKEDPETGRHLPEDTWWRRPFVASFEAGDFDFVVVVVHIRWGRKLTDRVREWEMLMDWVEYRKEKMRTLDPDVFVMGDFNTPNYDSDLIQVLTAGPLKLHPNVRSVKGTSLRGDKPYDLILYDPVATLAVGERIGVIDFIAGDHKALFPEIEKIVRFTYQVSDHLPLWIELDLTAEGEQIDFALSDLRRGQRRTATEVPQATENK